MREDADTRGVSYLGLALLLAGLLASAAVQAAGGSAALQRYGIVDLGTLAGGSTFGSGVNGAGDAVGYSDATDGGTHAFLWHAGRMADLGTLGGLNSYALAISDS